MLVNINDTVNEGDESTDEKITMKFKIKEKGTQCRDPIILFFFHRNCLVLMTEEKF